MSIGFMILFLSLIPALWKKPDLFCIGWILGSGLLGYEYAEVLYSRTIQDFIIQFPAPIGIANIGLNKLSAFFGVMFAIGLPIGFMYGNFYLSQHKTEGLRSHLFWLGLMGLSMHGILWLRHSLLFLMVWELMSLSSFFCVIQDREKSLKAGLNYLITMQVGACFLLVGFAIQYIRSRSFDFTTLTGMNDFPLYLILIGFAFKAGFFPFYSWLPQAHPVAPSHVSGIMSGLMVKTGFYGLLVMLTSNYFSLREVIIFIVVSMITAFLGVVNSMAENNIKRVLAYSTIENIGIMGIGISLGLLGIKTGHEEMATLCFAGSLLHIFFHSIFKPLLFYLSGNIICTTDTLDMDALGGLSKRMPRTSICFLIGLVAISALPLGNGFISEFTMLLGLFHGVTDVGFLITIASIASIGLLGFIGALALISFTKLYSIVFLGEARSQSALNAKEGSSGMLFPSFILASAVLLTGLIGNVSLRFVKPLLRWMDLDMSIIPELMGIYHQLSLILGMLVLIVIFLLLVRKKTVRIGVEDTWGCGYMAPNPKLQYTSNAYIQPLSYFLKPFLLISRFKDKANSLFPSKITYREEVLDFIYEWFILPSLNLLRKFFRLFSGIHTGKTNHYIAYTLIFLIFLLVYVLRWAQ